MSELVALHSEHLAACAPRIPLCIPVTWEAGPRPASSFLAYHHGWTDARFYDVVEIYRDGRQQSAFSGYVATVDDFGDLVPLNLKPAAERPFVVRGDLEYH